MDSHALRPVVLGIVSRDKPCLQPYLRMLRMTIPSQGGSSIGLPSISMRMLRCRSLHDLRFIILRRPIFRYTLLLCNLQQTQAVDSLVTCTACVHVCARLWWFCERTRVCGEMHCCVRACVRVCCIGTNTCVDRPLDNFLGQNGSLFFPNNHYLSGVDLQSVFANSVPCSAPPTY